MSKLTPAQQKIVDAMREGATIRSFHLSIWLATADGRPLGKDVSQRTFDALCGKGILKYAGRTESGQTSIYTLKGQG